MQTDYNFILPPVNQRIRLDVAEKVVLKESGEGHYKINSYKYTADYGTDLKLNLTNLIRGNARISKLLDIYIYINPQEI